MPLATFCNVLHEKEVNQMKRNINENDSKRQHTQKPKKKQQKHEDKTHQ